jgi:hypothetical protein
MPLALPALTSGLQSCFSSPPATALECARAWADAVVGYASGILPASTTVTAAGDALAAALASAFQAPAAAPLMESAFLQFATTVGLGMAGYAPVPPAGPVGFGPQFSGPHPTTHADAAQHIGTLIDAWMRLGVSTLIAPPNTPIPWS